MRMLGGTLIQFINEPLVIIGLAFIVAGISLVVLSTRITKAIRHSNEVKSDDKVNMTLKLTGMILILAGLIMISIYVIIYMQSR